MSEPKWLQLARAELGVRELSGSRHSKAILEYFDDSRNPNIDTDETPWCAAFVGAMLERSGIPSTRSLAARSYLQWGEKVTQPRPGDIAVFSRGNSSWQGHVAFYVGRDGNKIRVLGGNQSNAVTIANYDASRLLGYRRPKDFSPATEDMHDDAFEKACDIIGITAQDITVREYGLFMGDRTATSEERNRATPGTIRKIVRRNYWIETSCDQLPFQHAVFMLHTALRHTPRNARMFMQRAVKVDDDSIIGPITLRSIRLSKADEFIDAVIRWRTANYKTKEGWDNEGKKWTHEMHDLKDRILNPDQPTQSARLASPPQQPITQEKAKMTEAATLPTKPWSQSLTIWGTIVTFLSAVAPAIGSLIGLDVTAGDVQAVGNGVTQAIQAIGGVVGTVMAIYGRVRTKEAIAK